MKRLLFGAALAVLIAAGFTLPVQAAAPAAPHLHYQDLIKTTNDFGGWMTYFGRNATKDPKTLLAPNEVNAHIKLHIGTKWSTGRTNDQVVGILLGKMHLMNGPSGYRFHLDSYTDSHAVETVRWLFGANPHTPVVRLGWTYTVVGWSITHIRFLRMS